MAVKKLKLTSKQALFVQEYIIDFNATRAAKAAGYSPKTAFTIGVENLKKPLIILALQKAIGKREVRVERTADEVIDLLWKMTEYSLEDYFDISTEGEITAKRFDQLKPGAAKLINGIKFKKQSLKKGSGEQEFLSISDIEYKMPNKDRLIELLMKHHGLLIDKIQHGLDAGSLNILLAGIMATDPERAELVKKELIAHALKKKKV